MSSILPVGPGVSRDFTIHDYVPGQPIPTLIRDPRTGKYAANELKRYVKPYTLVTDSPSISLAGGRVSDPIPMVIDAKGHFEIFDAFFQSSQPEGFTVTLFETKDRPLLMNREIHVATIASGGGVSCNYEVFGSVGSAGRPFRWPQSLFLNVGESGRALIAVFRNLSASTNTIRFALHGLRWYHTQAPDKIAEKMASIYRHRFRSMPFFYTTDTNVRLQTGLFSEESDVRFTDEAYTEWSKLSAVSVGSSGDIDNPFNIRIVETATKKRFMEQPIRSDLVCGNGEFPFLLWEHSLFEPNYKLTFEVESLTPASDDYEDIYLTMACRKLFWDDRDDHSKLLRPGEAVGI